jgi:hypothetical protein
MTQFIEKILSFMDEIHYEHDFEMVNSYMMLEVDP